MTRRKTKEERIKVKQNIVQTRDKAELIPKLSIFHTTVTLRTPIQLKGSIFCMSSVNTLCRWWEHYRRRIRVESSLVE